jgi:hypothetical protein
MVEAKKRIYVNRVAATRRERIFELLCDPETATISWKELAKRVGLTPDGLQRYFSDKPFLAELEQRKAEARGGGGLAAVDRAMMKEAARGNVAAARLVYARMGHLGEQGSEDVEALVKELDEARAKLTKKKG